MYTRQWYFMLDTTFWLRVWYSSFTNFRKKLLFLFSKNIDATWLKYNLVVFTVAQRIKLESFRQNESLFIAAMTSYGMFGSRWNKDSCVPMSILPWFAEAGYSSFSLNMRERPNSRQVKRMLSPFPSKGSSN